MSDLIIFLLGLVVTAFTLVAVILTGISEAQDLREAGVLNLGAKRRARGAAAADRMKSLQRETR
ncbi:MAG: hypothetical protein ACYSU7_01505 [Planctomycetota bacterium]|jgi:hypothetical protein